ncbi:MAG: hypothetical protein ACOZAN_02460 [Patescibacteria group bacterium]
MKKHNQKNTVWNQIYFILFSVVLCLVIFQLSRPRISSNNFSAVDKSVYNGKTVADYFVEKFNIDREEAQELADKGVSFQIDEEMTLKEMTGILKTYGLIRDEQAFSYALSHTTDSHVADSKQKIMVGSNDIQPGLYGLSTSMDAWQMAQILVNYPQDASQIYPYVFMPGGPYFGHPQILPKETPTK